MKHPHATKIAAVLAATLALTLTLSACDRDAGAAPNATPKKAEIVAPVVPPTIAPTEERVVQRATERWAKVTKPDLIAAYDFYVPEAKREQSLASFLGRMEVHKYEDARVVEVVGMKDNMAFVRVSTLWTPIHEATKHVKLEPGQSLTERISMIETWRFVGGDWCYVRPDPEPDFFQEHPELLRKQDGASAATKSSSTADATKKPADDAAPKKN